MITALLVYLTCVEGASLIDELVKGSLNQTSVKAPFSQVNCGCQCSSLTYQLNDAQSSVQGNCMRYVVVILFWFSFQYQKFIFVIHISVLIPMELFGAMLTH